MSTYTDLHTRVIKENIAILRKPSQQDDGLTLQRVVFANKDNVYFGTFKGSLDLSNSTMVDTTINGGKLISVDVSNGIVKYDNGEITLSDIANNQLIDETIISTLQNDSAITQFCNEVSVNGLENVQLSTAISAMYDLMTAFTNSNMNT